MEMTTIKNNRRKDGSRQRTLQKILKFKHVYIILLPTMLFYLIFCYIPMFGNAIAFQDYSISKGIFGSSFAGLKNFVNFLTSYNFWQILRNTVAINLYGLIFGFPAPIILALLLNEVRHTRFKRTVQTITYMPHFISNVVVASIILTFVSSDGLINSIREIFGGQSISFMVEPKYFRTIYVISDIWQNIGWGSIIYIAALAGVSQELYEAATVDGANRWQQLWHVTLPGISTTIVIMLIMRIGQMMNVGYEKIILLYNPTIYETADVISTYVYRRGLLNGDYSYSTAVGMFNSVINLILLVSANYFSKRITGDGLW